MRAKKDATLKLKTAKKGKAGTNNKSCVTPDEFYKETHKRPDIHRIMEKLAKL